MYKLVISDFDKTLIDDDLAIPITTVIALDRLRRKKVKFAVATGRNVNFVLYYIKDVNFIDYVVALNGSYVYDVVKEKVIFEKSFKMAEIKSIIKKYKNSRVKIYLYTDHSRCYLNINNEETNEIVIRDLDDFLKNNKVYKIEIHTKNNKERIKIKEEIDKNYDLSASFQEYENKDYLVEIMPKGISKASGAAKILNKEKIDFKDIVAFGDSYNDIELLKNAGLSVAVSNAVADVKKICKEKTLSNNEKGVEKSIIRIFNLK